MPSSRPAPMWVVEWTPQRPWTEIASHLPDHLEYLGDLEARGHVFASGPFPAADGEPDGSGMTVLRAGSAAEAERLAAGDPLAVRGLRRFTLRRWSVLEGGITVTVRYSDGTFALGEPS